MALIFHKLHPCFVAEVSPIKLRDVHDRETLEQIRAGMDQYAVLVFHDQFLSDDEHIAFAQRFDGELHTKTGISALQKSRLGNEALADISNLDETGDILKSDDRRRMYGLGNRLWHTDASFQDPARSLLDALGQSYPSSRRRHPVRRYARSLRCVIGGDERAA